MVIQGSQKSRAPEASRTYDPGYLTSIPQMLILMGLPRGVGGSGDADRGGEERNHEGDGRGEQQGHPDPNSLPALSGRCCCHPRGIVWHVMKSFSLQGEEASVPTRSSGTSARRVSDSTSPRSGSSSTRRIRPSRAGVVCTPDATRESHEIAGLEDDPNHRSPPRVATAAPIDQSVIARRLMIYSIT